MLMLTKDQCNVKGVTCSSIPENYHPTLLFPSFIPSVSVHCLGFTVHNFAVLPHWQNPFVVASGSDLGDNTLINPLYATCLASNSKQKAFGKSWWSLSLLKNSFYQDCLGTKTELNVDVWGRHRMDLKSLSQLNCISVFMYITTIGNLSHIYIQIDLVMIMYQSRFQISCLSMIMERSWIQFFKVPSK